MTSAPGPQSYSEAVDAQAREWLTYLYSGEATEEGRIQFEVWVNASEAHRDAMRLAEGIWTSLDLVPGIESALADAAQTAARDGAPLRDGRAWRARLARLFAFGGFSAWATAGACAIGLFAFIQFHDPVIEQRFATAAGELRTIALPDGTQVYLRPETTLVSRFSRARRFVQLVEGGAFFDVTRDAQKPFCVEVAGTEVRVLGTQFDVLEGPRNVQVRVREGHVRVIDLPEEGSDDAVSAVALTQGQEVVAGLDGALGEVRLFDPEQALSWREGRLSYANARLEDVIAEANRYRAIKIVVASPALNDLRITTAFRVQNSDQMLAGLAAAERIRIERTPQAIVLHAE